MVAAESAPGVLLNMGVTRTADLGWYIGVSRIRGGAAHCPFANVHRCPRYFQSVSLLGDSITTPLQPELERELVATWKRTEFWPVVREEETSTIGDKRGPRIFSNFCPEVTGLTFGVFASRLARYADELDVDLAHRRLSETHAEPNDFRWAWSTGVPLHYSDCPIYSLLARSASQAKREEIVELKPRFLGFTVNVKAFVRRFERRLPAWLVRLIGRL
jgi:hypothetical protein